MSVAFIEGWPGYVADHGFDWHGRFCIECLVKAEKIWCRPEDLLDSMTCKLNAIRS